MMAENVWDDSGLKDLLNVLLLRPPYTCRRRTKPTDLSAILKEAS
jgi:hypothetical protein